MKDYLNKHKDWLPILLLLGFIAFIVAKFTRMNDDDGIGGKVEHDRAVINPTISQDQAYAIAEELFLAMQKTFGIRFDNFKIAYARMSNMSDYNMVFNAFGEQYYNRLSGATLAMSKYFDPELNLTEWMMAELSIDQRNEIKSLRPQITVL